MLIPILLGEKWKWNTNFLSLLSKPTLYNSVLPSSTLKSKYNDNQSEVVDSNLIVKQIALDIPTGIQFEKSEDKNVISQYSIDVLEELMTNSGNSSILITSTKRTPRRQAELMYEFYLGGGLYTIVYSKKVIDVGREAKNKGFSQEKILEIMTQEILAQGPNNVSHHLGDFTNLNVIDVAPSSVANKSAFMREIAKRNIKFVGPPRDKAFHLEINQIIKSE
jgi:hypothetical protein